MHSISKDYEVSHWARGSWFVREVSKPPQAEGRTQGDWGGVLFQTLAEGAGWDRGSAGGVAISHSKLVSFYKINGILFKAQSDIASRVKRKGNGPSRFAVVGNRGVSRNAE